MPWDEYADDLAPMVSDRLGIAQRDAERAVSDPAQLAARVRALPGIAIAVLEILVDVGGETSMSALVALAKERLGIGEGPLSAALVALDRAALAFSFDAGPQRVRFIALLDVSGDAIAGEVRGLTLPDPPDAAIAPAEADTSLRDDVAALATVAHVPVRLNRDGRANLTSAKKLAAVIGRNETETMALLDRAIDAGVLGARGVLLAPRAAALRRLARGELAWGPGGASADAYQWTPADRWISREALIRALAARSLHEARRYSYLGMSRNGDPVAARQAAERAIDRAGLARLEHGGEVFVRRPGRSAGAGGDGHVTPSFEVMLGPAADAELAAVVALAAEPVRFDRVVTRKLTPASIAAAQVEGLAIDDVVEALERVGRHGLADNVRAMIADWARSARTIRARQVWALEASTPEAADLAARALQASVVARPTPTLVLVDGTLASPETALAKTAVKVSGAVATIARPTRSLEVQTEAPEWLDRRPAAELRARARDTSGLPVPGESVRQTFAPSSVLELLAQRESGTRRDFLLLVARLWAAAEREFAAWAAKLSAEARDDALGAAVQAPIDFMLWLALAPKHRAKVLLRARSIVPLVEMDLRRLDLSKLSGDGRELVRLLRSSAVVEMLIARDDTAGDDDDAPAPPQPSTRSRDGRPAARDLGVQSRDDVERALREATDAGAALWLRVQSKSQGDRVVGLRPERLLARGAEVAVLGTDVETGDGRSFPLANVVACRPA